MNPVDFVPLKASQADTLGPLRQKAWASAYRGIYPDDMIDRFDYAWHKERDPLRIRNPKFDHYFIQKNQIPVGYLT